MQSPEDCVKQRTARIGILGGVPAFLLTLALGLLAFAPAALAAPATCTVAGASPVAGDEGGLGQEFSVGTGGADLHAYSLVASATTGGSLLTILPFDGTGKPDPAAPIAARAVDLPATSEVTTVTLAPAERRLAEGRYVVFLQPATGPTSSASWELCAPAAPAGGLWFEILGSWTRSGSESLALGLDLRPEDLTAPVVSVTPPVSPTRTPSVGFTSDDPTATYTCSADGAAATACTSPFSPAGLADGPHTVAVVARDEMGNVSSPATAAFTVDTAAPAATITIVPGNAADHSTAVTVVLSEPGTFTCLLDGLGVACGASFTVVPDAEGQHTLTVTATDTLGNAGDTQATFLADWTAPQLPALDDLEVVADASQSADRQRPGAEVDWADPAATDNLDPAPATVCAPASGSFFPLGATVVTCAARDASGNLSAPVSFTVTVVQPPAATADVDLAFDPEHGDIAVTESHGGTIDWAGHRTLTATTGDHETRVNLRSTDDVADVDHLDDGLSLVYLRYDGGQRLRPTTNGYAFRSSERRDGSIRRLVIAVRAGRNAVIVTYSAARDRSVVRYRDLQGRDRTLRVVRVSGLVIPHLRSDAGRMVIDVGGGG